MVQVAFTISLLEVMQKSWDVWLTSYGSDMCQRAGAHGRWRFIQLMVSTHRSGIFPCDGSVVHRLDDEHHPAKEAPSPLRPSSYDKTVSCPGGKGCFANNKTRKKTEVLRWNFQDVDEPKEKTSEATLKTKFDETSGSKTFFLAPKYR